MPRSRKVVQHRGHSRYEDRCRRVAWSRCHLLDRFPGCTPLYTWYCWPSAHSRRHSLLEASKLGRLTNPLALRIKREDSRSGFESPESYQWDELPDDGRKKQKNQQVPRIGGAAILLV